MVTPDGKKAVEVIKECKKFVEVKDLSFILILSLNSLKLTGEAGDVFLCHPLMVSENFSCTIIKLMFI